VQLRRKVFIEVEPTFDKIVTRRRGGWCYEMNGLLAWALEEIGFEVRKLAGGVMRVVRGDDTLGNHLVLLVTIDGEEYIADTGFGDGLIDPIPLKPSNFIQRGLQMKLEENADGFWRFHNHEFGGASSFDFSLEPASTDLLSKQSQWLQTNESSPFRMALVCQTFSDSGIEVQLGRVSKSINSEGIRSIVLDSPEQLHSRLVQTFGIDEPQIFNLWPTIVERHRVVTENEPD